MKDSPGLNCCPEFNTFEPEGVGFSGSGVPGETLPETANKLDLLDYDFLHRRNMLFGTAEYVSEKIQEMSDKLDLETLLVWSSFPGVPHGAAMDSIARFTEQVMPNFSGAPA